MKKRELLQMSLIQIFVLVFVVGILSTSNVYGQLENVTEQMVITEDGAIVEGKHFDNILDKQALVINASNVTVRGCLFTNCTWAVGLQPGVSYVEITGNRFENTGSAINGVGHSDHIKITYNEGVGIGIYNLLDAKRYPGLIHGMGSSNFAFLINTSYTEINYNIIDNKDLDTKYLEDCINMYSENYGNVTGECSNNTVKGNKLRGTDNTCNISGSGGGVVFDCIGENDSIVDNIIIRMAGYGAALAGVHNSVIQNNYAYYPLDHVDNYNKHPNSATGNGGAFAFGNTNFNATCSIITGNKLIDNHGYSINMGADAPADNPDNCISKGSGEIWNIYETCTGEGSFEVKTGNVYPSSNPHWDSLLDDDMFANLGPEYFSSHISDYNPPAAPKNTTANAFTTKITLNWDDNSEEDLASYSVKRSIVEGGSYTQIASGITLSQYSDIGLSSETTYYYVVTALDTAGNESAISNKVSATTLAQDLNNTTTKTRVIHTTDMGFDDENSLVRMLLFANNQDIIGITPSAGPWQDQIDNEYENILAKIDLYDQVYDNLRKHDPDYPTPNYLRSVTKHGNVADDHGDYSYDTDGSILIANALLDKSDDSNIWVTCWGGPVTLTAALRYINDNYPDEKAYVANKLKIYFIAAKYQDTDDKANINYILNHYNPAPVMLESLAYGYTNGWGEVKYWCDNADYSTESWTNANYNRDHGVLANSFVWKNGWNDDVDGDAGALLHILSSALGLRSTEGSTYGGWGTRFSDTKNSYGCYDNYIIDEWESPNKLPDSNKDSWMQKRCYSGARWADEFQNALAVRADWCVNSFDNANHAPSVELLIPKDIKAITGDTINLRCTAFDPDNDSLSYLWWQYKEAGTLQKSVTIQNADSTNASIVCPAGKGTLHFILEVKDNGKGHPLTQYARVVIEIGDDRSDITPPAAPDSLTVTSAFSSQINLNWGDNTESDFASYSVKRANTSGGLYTTIANGINSSNYSDSGLSSETTYYYIVIAVDTAGNKSENSLELVATTNLPVHLLPQSYYDFEEISGTSVIDGEVAKNDGAMVGSAIERATGGIVSSETDGQGCIELTGSPYSVRSYVEIPFASFHNSSNYTFSAWVKWEGASDEWGYLFWQNGDDALKTRHIDMWWDPRSHTVASVLHDNTGAEFRVVPAPPAEINLYDGEWHQVAISLENDTIVKIWTDGELSISKISTNPIALTATENNLWIGCMPDGGGTLKMVGFIDRVRIYDFALTQDDISYLYSIEEPIPTVPSGLSAISKRGMVELDWDDNSESNLGGYNIMRSETSGGSFEQIATDIASSDYSDLTVSPTTTYYYVVTAVSKKGYESETSDEVSATTPENSQPQSFYDFEEISGTSVIDGEKAKNDGTLVGTEIVRATGGIVSSETDGQGCIELTGSPYSVRSYVEIPFAYFHNSSNYTFSAWVKWKGASDEWGYLFWQNGDDALKTRHVDMWWDPRSHTVASVLHDNTDAEFGVVPAPPAEINLYDGEWHQVAISLENDTVVKIWTDGKLSISKVSTNPIALTATENNLWIGCMPDGDGTLKMVGFIDRVRIYDFALTEGEIVYLYNSESPAETPPTTIKETTNSAMFGLKQNRPNPFGSETIIEYDIQAAGNVQLQVINITGSVVATLTQGNKQPGNYKVKWNATEETGGIYFYKLTVITSKGVFSETKKMILF